MIETKPCSICKTHKLLTDFHKDKYQKDGLVTKCKTCSSRLGREFNEKNRLKLLKDPPNITEKQCARCGIVQPTGEFHKSSSKKDGLVSNCKKCVSKQAGEFFINNRDKVLSQNKRWKDQNKAYRKIKSKEYRSKPEVKKREREQHGLFRKKVRENAVIYLYKRFEHTVRERIRRAYKRGTVKTKSTKENLGCEFKFFKDYIHNLLAPPMTPENYGKIWVLDHIIPVKAFNVKNPDELNKAFNYHNYQPLLRSQNYEKLDWFPDGTSAKTFPYGARLFDYLMETQRPKESEPLKLDEKIFKQAKRKILHDINMESRGYYYLSESSKNLFLWI